METISIILSILFTSFVFQTSQAKQHCGQVLEREATSKTKVVEGNQVTWYKYPWMVRLSVYYEAPFNPMDDFQYSAKSNFSCDVIATKKSQLRRSQPVLGKSGVNTIVSLCGGTIISPKHILTAGHCLMPENTQPRYVVHFGHSQTSQQTTLFAHRVYKHPNCTLINSDRALNDLAILELQSRLPANKHYSPACLPKSGHDYTNQKVIVAGWGNTVVSVQELQLPDTLKEAEMRVIERSKCEKEHSYADLTGQLCAVSDSGFPGVGDSGGPLMFVGRDGWTVMGVVSWGNETRFRTSPFVFTNVAAHRSWIDGIIANA